jgi:hypothetical protein
MAALVKELPPARSGSLHSSPFCIAFEPIETHRDGAKQGLRQFVALVTSGHGFYDRG